MLSLSTPRQSPDAVQCLRRHKVPIAGISYSVYDRQIQLHFTDAAAAATTTVNSTVAAACNARKSVRKCSVESD